jgi:bacterioferritin
MDLVQLYLDAATHSARIGSYDDRVFFQALLEEEQAHAKELIQWMQDLERPLGEGVQQRIGGFKVSPRGD